MFDENVRLPWDMVLTDQLDPANPEDQEVWDILKRLEARALRNDDFPGGRVVVQSNDMVTDSKGFSKERYEIQIPQNQQVTTPAKKSRGRRRQHANPAERQRAYRARKAENRDDEQMSA
jgi:hypothetical protein